MKKKPTNKPKLVIIDRKRWSNKENHDRLEAVGRYSEAVSYLRDEHGRMCCLGFYANACGVKLKDLVNVSAPSGLPRDLALKIVGMAKVSSSLSGITNTALASDLMETNDDDGRTPKKREKRIAALFRKIGVTVKFTGEYLNPRPRKIT